HDDLRVYLSQVLITEAGPAHDPRREILDHHVAFRDECSQQSTALWMFEVEREATFGVVLLKVIGALGRTPVLRRSRLQPLKPRTSARRCKFDLDDVGAGFG